MTRRRRRCHLGLQDVLQVLQEGCGRCPWWTPGGLKPQEHASSRTVVPPAWATSGNMSGLTCGSSQPNLACKCTARRGSGRCSAQLSSPDPCPQALPQHPRPPLQGVAAAAHPVALWSECERCGPPAGSGVGRRKLVVSPITFSPAFPKLQKVITKLILGRA